MADTIELELDSRQRLPLARILDAEHATRFRVTELGDGEFLLTPVVSVSERELAMLRNPEAMASLQRGIDEAAAGKVVRHGPGHFAKLAADLGPDADQ